MKIKGEKIEFLTKGPGKRCFSRWKDASELDDIEFRLGEKVLDDAEIKDQGLEEALACFRACVTFFETRVRVSE